MKTAFAALLHSRKFLVLVLDTLVSLALYFSARYLGQSAVEDIRFVILGLQPIAMVLIAAIAAEDIAATRASALIYYADVNGDGLLEEVEQPDEEEPEKSA